MLLTFIFTLSFDMKLAAIIVKPLMSSSNIMAGEKVARYEQEMIKQINRIGIHRLGLNNY